MGEQYDEFPGVEVSIEDEDMITPGPKGHRYVHIDEFVSHDQTGVKLHLYIFDDEDKRDDLRQLGNELREKYTFATCIVWPASVRDYIEGADEERMRALEWAYAIAPYVDDMSLEQKAEEIEKHISDDG